MVNFKSNKELLEILEQLYIGYYNKNQKDFLQFCVNQGHEHIAPAQILGVHETVIPSLIKKYKIKKGGRVV